MDDVEVAVFGVTMLLSMAYLLLKNRNKRRRYWVRPYLWNRRESGRYYVDVSSIIMFSPPWHFKITITPLKIATQPENPG